MGVMRLSLQTPSVLPDVGQSLPAERFPEWQACRPFQDDAHVGLVESHFFPRLTQPKHVTLVASRVPVLPPEASFGNPPHLPQGQSCNYAASNMGRRLLNCHSPALGRAIPASRAFSQTHNAHPQKPTGVFLVSLALGWRQWEAR